VKSLNRDWTDAQHEMWDAWIAHMRAHMDAIAAQPPHLTRWQRARRWVANLVQFR
jgi:hypothetical protein